MAQSTKELKLEYRGGVAAGIRKFEKMRPLVEKMVFSDLYFEESSSNEESVLFLKIPINCNKKGLIGILQEFGFRHIL